MRTVPYAPFMQQLFQTRPLPVGSRGLMIAVAVALFVIVEIENAVIRRWGQLQSCS